MRVCASTSASTCVAAKAVHATVLGHVGIGDTSERAFEGVNVDFALHAVEVDRRKSAPIELATARLELEWRRDGVHLSQRPDQNATCR